MPWWPSGLGCVSNSSKRSLEDPGLNPARGVFIRTNLDGWIYRIIWLTPNISHVMKQSLLSISANALRSCLMYNCKEISFENIHILCKKSTPKQITSYQTAISLHKVLNSLDQECSSEHVRILNNMVCTRRQLRFEIIKDNRFKIGMNSVLNKFYHINKEISLDSLNLAFVHFKKLMKFQYLKYGKTWSQSFPLLTFKSKLNAQAISE